MKALKDLSIAELVALHNDAAAKAGVKPVKTFRDRKTAVARVAKLTKVKKERGTVIEFPLPAHPKGLQHAIRATSFRGVLLEALKDGLTREQMTKLAEKHGKFKDPAAKAWGTLLLLHNYNGVGIKETNGKYYAVVPK